MSEDLEKIQSLLQELVTKQALTGSELQSIKEDIDQIKHVLLEGNGTPAMTVRVALAEAELDRLKEERTDKKMPRSAWLAIVVSVVLALLSIGAAAV